MATRAVFTPNAGDENDDNQQNHDEGDNPKDLHPTGCPINRIIFECVMRCRHGYFSWYGLK
jgi:hypothetical protein